MKLVQDVNEPCIYCGVGCKTGTHNYTPTNSSTVDGIYTVYQMICTKCEHVIAPNPKATKYWNDYTLLPEGFIPEKDEKTHA